GRTGPRGGAGAAELEGALPARPNRALRQVDGRRGATVRPVDPRPPAPGWRDRGAGTAIAPHHRVRGRLGIVDGPRLPGERRLRVPPRPGDAARRPRGRPGLVLGAQCLDRSPRPELTATAR